MGKAKNVQVTVNVNFNFPEIETESLAPQDFESQIMDLVESQIGDEYLGYIDFDFDEVEVESFDED